MRLFRALVVAFVPAVLLVAAPASAAAQDDMVYSQSELDTPPKFTSTQATASLLAKSYPQALKSAGVTGTVQVQFVVDHEGKVDGQSVKVLSASVPALGDAAKSVVTEIKFKPGQIAGKAVKSVVLLPIVYK